MNKEFINTIRQYDEQKTELTEYLFTKMKDPDIMSRLTTLAFIATIRVCDIMEKDGELSDIDLTHLCVKLGALSYAESFIQRSLDN
jgi:hypothetical protein